MCLSVASGTVQLCTVSFFAMACEEICWGVGAVYAIESFPTALRSSAIAVLMFFSHIGGVLSLSLGETFLAEWTSLPFVVMGGIDVIGFASCLMLPSAEKPSEEDLADILPPTREKQKLYSSYGSGDENGGAEASARPTRTKA